MPLESERENNIKEALRFREEKPNLEEYVGDTLSLTIELNHEDADEYERHPGHKLIMIDALYLSQERHLSFEFLDRYKDVLDWPLISKYAHWTDKMYDKFQPYISWMNHLKHQFVSKHILRKFAHLMKPYHYVYLSWYQVLGFDFIKEFQRRLPREIIIKRQFLSDRELEQLPYLRNWKNNEGTNDK